MSENGVVRFQHGNLDPSAQEFRPTFPAHPHHHPFPFLPPPPPQQYFPEMMYPPPPPPLPQTSSYVSHTPPPTFLPPSIPPPASSPTRALLLTAVPPDVSESIVRRELEIFGDVRAVQMGRVSEGIVTVHFYDLRAAHAALDAVREQHMQHQNRLRIHYSSILAPNPSSFSGPPPPPPPPPSPGLIAGRPVWAQFTVPATNAFPDGQNQGTLVIFNLNPSVSALTLKDIFQPFGAVKELRETPMKRQQRFVEFYDVRDASRALAEMNGKEINGRSVMIEFSRPGGYSNKKFNPHHHFNNNNNNKTTHHQFPNSNFHHHSYHHNSKPFPSPQPPQQPPPPPPPPPPFSLRQRRTSPRQNSTRRRRCSPSSDESLDAVLGGRKFNNNNNNNGGGRKGGHHSNNNKNHMDMNLKVNVNGIGSGNCSSSGSSSSPSMKQQQERNSGGGKVKPWRKQKNFDPRFLIKEDAIVVASSSSSGSASASASASCNKDTRTTVMIKNIPNKYSQKLLLNMLDNHCIHCNEQIASTTGDDDDDDDDDDRNDDKPLSSYDFVYLPIDFNNKCNVGYGFVNMTSPEATLRLYKAFHHQHWEVFNSRKICEVTYARVQGLEALKEHFKNSKFACENDEYLPVVFSPPRDGRHLPAPLPIVAPNTTSSLHHDIVDTLTKTTTTSASASSTSGASIIDHDPIIMNFNSITIIEGHNDHDHDHDDDRSHPSSSSNGGGCGDDDGSSNSSMGCSVGDY